MHVIALILIGRRAVQFTRDHVVIPDNLTTRQYVFVAGFPAAVFMIGVAAAVLGLLNAATYGQAMVALAAILICGFGVASAAGDVQLIVVRLSSKDSLK